MAHNGNWSNIKQSSNCYWFYAFIFKIIIKTLPVKYKAVQRNIELNMRGKFLKKKFYKLTCSSPWGILCLSWICTGPPALTLSMNQLTFRRLVCWGRAAIFNTFKTWATVSYSVTTWVTLLLLRKKKKIRQIIDLLFFPRSLPQYTHP